MAYVLSDEEEKAYKKVDDKYERSNTSLTSLFKRFNEIEDSYFGYLKPAQKSAQSNVYDPIVFEQVEHVSSHMFSDIPKGTFIPSDYDTPEEDDTRSFKAEVADQLVSYQMNKAEQHTKKKLLLAGKTAYLFGYSFAITYWRYERVFDKATNKFVTKWDDPCFDIPPIYDCYYDVDASNPYSMTYFIWDEYKTMDELESANAMANGQKKYQHLSDLKELVKDGTMAISSQYRDNAAYRRGIRNRNTDRKDRIKVRHYYDKDKWITVCPDYMFVIENRSNPYPFDLPVSILIDHDFPNLPTGIGEIEPIRTLAIASTQFLNMRFDNVKNILEPPIKARASALKYAATWLFKRNQIWEVDDIDDVAPFVFPDVTGATFNETMSYIQSRILKATGRQDYQNLNSRMTQLEIKAVFSEQTAREKYKENNIDDFITDIWEKFLKLDQLFLKKERQIRIIGADNIQQLSELYPDKVHHQQGKTYGWLDTNPDDIYGQFNFQVESGSTKTSSITTDVTSMTQALQAAVPLFPEFEKAGIQLNLKAPLEKLFTDLGVKNPDQIFQVPPPPPQIPQTPGAADIVDNFLNKPINGSTQPQQQGIQSAAGAIAQPITRVV